MSSSIKDTAGKEITPKEGEKEKKRRRLKPAVAAPDTGRSSPISEVKKLKVEAKVGNAKAIYAMEEAEVEARDPYDDVQQQKQACSEIRAIMDQIKAIKATGSKDQELIDLKRVDATLEFVTLKKLNRLGHLRSKKSRDATNDAKLKVDQHHLQLQNLLYEVTHLQKEITKCLEFQSKDEDINLVSVEEFYKEAPQEISRPEVTKTDPHQLTLARLDWELEQRKMLSSKMLDAEGSKDTIAQEIKTKREYLESLQPKLNTILQSTKPVQDYLKMPFDETREQHRTAKHLPQPLYVLYMQSSAYQEACDKRLSVSIQGDVDVAMAMSNTRDDDDDDSDSDQEETEKQSKKRRRRRSEDKKTAKKQKVLKKHPLSVVLNVQCKDGSVMHLTFYYLVALSIVTVTVKITAGTDSVFSSVSGGDLLSPDSLLSCMYPEDFGSETPNPANVFMLNRMGLEEFSHYISEVGRPYMWAQWLAGLQFLNAEEASKPDSSLSASYMEGTVKCLRKRLQARQALQKQLASLERCTVPVDSESQHLFPAKISSSLKQWRRATFQDLMSLPFVSEKISTGLIKETDLFFMGSVDRGSAKMNFYVAMSPDYPKSAPVFAVSINWKTLYHSINNQHVRDMEAEVNIHFDELLPGKSHDQLLTNQVQRLLMCFDVFLETESADSSTEGPLEYIKEKIFPRITRGPNRCKPYVYYSAMGFFSQR